MALTRRANRTVSATIWPGFVDAMTALLLVLMFVLTIFMVVQYVLRETISGQESELDVLSAQVAELASALGLEQDRSATLRAQVGMLNANIASAEVEARRQAALVAGLTEQVSTGDAALVDAQTQITAFEAQVAALIAARDTALAEGETLTARVGELEAANTTLVGEQEALNLALARARDEVDAEAEAARLAAARREAIEAMVAELQTSLAERETSLAQVLAQLESGNDAMLGALERIRDKDAALEQGDAALATALAQLEGEKASGADVAARIAVLEAQLTEAEKTRLAEVAAAEALRQRLADAEGALSDEEAARLAEVAAAEALRQKLENADTELTAMTLALEEARKKAEDTLTLLAAAEAVEGDLNTKLAAALLETEALRAATGNETELRDRLAAALAAQSAAETEVTQAMTEAERQAVLLATASAALATEKATSTEAQRQVALLNEQVAALRAQLGQLQALLDDYETRDSTAQVQIQKLGSDLNAALARVAAEERRRAELEEAERKRAEAEAARLAEEARLAKEEVKDLAAYRSEFFGRMRQILSDREGVRVVGDRFVFSSEVLFPPGSADLSPGGQEQIARVAGTLAEVAGEIPPEIDWVIRVDGHTDKTQLGAGGLYADNWELSQARALSVVHFMTRELGFPADRLAATGFGEFQPVASGDSPEAYAANRRIELKLTEK